MARPPLPAPPETRSPQNGDMLPVRADGLPVSPEARRAALVQLNEMAAAAPTPEEAHEIMVKAGVFRDFLERSRASREEMWLAAKASVLAARRLGAQLEELDSRRLGPGRTTARGIVMRELQISSGLGSTLRRLARLVDPEFQRYIQDSEKVPSVNGALVACGVWHSVRKGRRSGSFANRRRLRAGVKTPQNPSIDAAHSQIVLALGHLGGALNLSARNKVKLAALMDDLYAIEDALRPMTSGYHD